MQQQLRERGPSTRSKSVAKFDPRRANRSVRSRRFFRCRGGHDGSARSSGAASVPSHAIQSWPNTLSQRGPAWGAAADKLSIMQAPPSAPNIRVLQLGRRRDEVAQGKPLPGVQRPASTGHSNRPSKAYGACSTHGPFSAARALSIREQSRRCDRCSDGYVDDDAVSCRSPLLRWARAGKGARG